MSVIWIRVRPWGVTGRNNKQLQRFRQMDGLPQLLCRARRSAPSWRGSDVVEKTTDAFYLLKHAAAFLPKSPVTNGTSPSRGVATREIAACLGD